MLKTSSYIVIILTLLISKSVSPSYAQKAMYSSKRGTLPNKFAISAHSNFAVAENLSTRANHNFVNSCQRVANRLAPSANNMPNKSKTKKETNRIDKKQNRANLPQTSIWWAVEQFDPFDGSLIQDWLTHPQQQQLNLTVNLQLWTLLDYFGRYRFVNQFGTVTRKYGYSLNILNQQEQCLATYQYNPIAQPPKWELHLQKLGRDSLQVDEPKNQIELTN